MSASSTSKGFADLATPDELVIPPGVQVRKLDALVQDMFEHVVFGHKLDLEAVTKFLVQGDPPTVAVRYGNEARCIVITLGAVFESRAEVAAAFNALALARNALSDDEREHAWRQTDLARDPARMAQLIQVLVQHGLVIVGSSLPENNEP